MIKSRAATDCWAPEGGRRGWPRRWFKWDQRWSRRTSTISRWRTWLRLAGSQKMLPACGDGYSTIRDSTVASERKSRPTTARIFSADKRSKHGWTYEHLAQQWPPDWSAICAVCGLLPHTARESQVGADNGADLPDPSVRAELSAVRPSGLTWPHDHSKGAASRSIRRTTAALFL